MTFPLSPTNGQNIIANGIPYSYSTSTNAWTRISSGVSLVATTATTATNIANGGPGQIPYQSSTGTTAFISTGSTGTVLVSAGAGSAPAFTSTGSIYVNSAVNANNIIGGATNQIPYQSSTGTTTFSGNLTFNSATGELTCVDINTTSDMNLKNNVSTISNPWNILENIRGVQFNWKESGQLSYGLIAQELEQTLPELVGTNDSGLKSIRYLPLIGILLEAIKAQQAQIDQLIEKIK